MQDLIYVGLTVGFFALIGAMLMGCEHLIGKQDGPCVPGGLGDGVNESTGTP